MIDCLEYADIPVPMKAEPTRRVPGVRREITQKVLAGWNVMQWVGAVCSEALRRNT